MKVVYIIGPIRSQSLVTHAKNIRRAKKIAMKLWHAGFAVICPHTNSGFITDKLLEICCIKGDIELLKRSDFAVLIGNWANSEGSINEFRWCVTNNKRIYVSVEEAIQREKIV